MPILALISAYDSAGSQVSRASSCWQAGGELSARLAQRRVSLGDEQVLLDGALEPANQHQLVGQPVIQSGDHGRVSADGKTQGALVLRNRLPVRG
jgi:hypothetical protein